MATSAPLLGKEGKKAAHSKASIFYGADEYLEDPGRTWPVLHNVMAMVLGGKHRWNEMLFHDVHHAFPNAVGTLSQRGRFHGWEKVHDAAAEVLHRGLWKPNGDEETQMQKTQKKRSLMMKQGK
ncbi:AMT1-1 [Symbiodinium sp. CCMP2456]|nr:AMT1-1 [Symbiodinium sp. CCMP2456]